MKTQLKLIFGLMALIVLTDYGVCSSVENFTKTVHYIAPTNFYLVDYSGDYSTPFSIGGSAIEYDHDPNSSIMFELGLACFSHGIHGSEPEFFSTKPSDLKNDFENFYSGKLTNMPSSVIITNMSPAKIGKMGGLTAVSSSIVTRPSVLGPCNVYLCWVQIKTNIVVKITAASCDLETFKALTNSLQSLKIDKNGILKQVASQK